jgi:dephospho-CoA kinase
MKRNGYTREEAAARIHSQMPIDEKKALADDVIDNSRTIQWTKKQLEKWVTQLNLNV